MQAEGSVVDDRFIARWRLASQWLDGARPGDAVDVVGHLLAVQAENHAQASFALASRSTDLTAAAIVEQFDRGDILRTHVLRPTWHFVRPADLVWLADVTAPRARRTFRDPKREFGLEDADLDRAADAIVRMIDGEGPRTRPELHTGLVAAGVPDQGRAIGMCLMHAEFGAMICSGPLRGGDHTYALVTDRAPGARRLDREEALAELALRYVTSHGPVTDRDLAYWATLTLADVRAGLAAVADQLEAFEYDDRTFWIAGDPPATDGVPEPRGHLLLRLDEFHNGVQDSRSVLDADGIVPDVRAPNVGMTLVDGQMLGGMRRTLRTDDVEFAIDLYRPLTNEERDIVDQAAARHAAFLELEASVVYLS